ncbi:MAG: homoserine dehydrogenase [Deltaproteobacteria bacterium]
MSSPREVGVGLLGLGNVGAAFARQVEAQAPALLRGAGVRLAIVSAAVRDPARRRDAPLPEGAIGADPARLVQDPRVGIVVELFGGLEPAGALVRDAIARGKHVVTANKRLLAEEGEELFAEAARRGVALRYEGAVCGGLPIVRLLREALQGDRVRAIHGVVNGTTNYILGRMGEAGLPLGEALAEAQAAGYAEADPTLDLSGGDAAQKLCLLAGLAFGVRVRPEELFVEGIEQVTPQDFAAARELGCVVKLLAVARREEGGAGGERLDLRVHPAMVPERGPLASIRGALNGLLVETQALGPLVLSAPGAGGEATASAVLADVIDIARLGAAAALPFTGRARATLVPTADLVSAYHLRFTVDDAPGVLAALTQALGRRRISIAALHQRDRQRDRREGGAPVTIVLLTHRAREGDLREAVAEIDRLETSRAPTRLLRVETEGPLGSCGDCRRDSPLRRGTRPRPTADSTGCKGRAGACPPPKCFHDPLHPPGRWST